MTKDTFVKALNAALDPGPRPVPPPSLASPPAGAQVLCPRLSCCCTGVRALARCGGGERVDVRVCVRNLHVPARAREGALAIKTCVVSLWHGGGFCLRRVNLPLHRHGMRTT